MKVSKSTFANLVIAAFLLASPFLIGASSSGLWPYEPWWDVNADGVIDIQDVARVSGAFGTFGDSTKNVNVTNWPITRTEETTVFYANSSFPLTSANYSASGFSYLHIFLHVLYAGPGSSCEFRVRGLFQDPNSSKSRWANAYIATMTEDPRRDVLSVTIPVPSETFCFYVLLLSGGANVFLSFYLTQS